MLLLLLLFRAVEGGCRILPTRWRWMDGWMTGSPRQRNERRRLLNEKQPFSMDGRRGVGRSVLPTPDHCPSADSVLVFADKIYGGGGCSKRRVDDRFPETGCRRRRHTST